MRLEYNLNGADIQIDTGGREPAPQLVALLAAMADGVRAQGGTVFEVAQTEVRQGWWPDR